LHHGGHRAFFLRGQQQVKVVVHQHVGMHMHCLGLAVFAIKSNMRSRSALSSRSAGGYCPAR
jgi:hypothetical protein